MRWAAASSQLSDTGFAADAVATELQEALGPGSVDLVLVYFGPAHVGAASTLGDTFRRALDPGCLIATSAHGVVTTEHEYESGPAISVLAARLPGVGLHPFILTRETWARPAQDLEEFERMAPGAVGAELIVLTSDPFSLPIEPVLAGFHDAVPDVRIVGGLASAGVRPNSNTLILNDWVAHEGGVALAFSGAIRADVVVSQGCQPVGPPLTVTRSDGNVLVELDGQPALERTEQVLRELTEAQREQLRHGLYVGRPVRTGAEGRGDYLIRNLLGADRDRGVIAIGDVPSSRERIRFHVRDAKSAREDLELLLSPQEFDTRAHAALLFACNGRGRGLHGRADGDIRIIQEELGGNIPAAGMFCAGEIGPVGGRNFLHGHTASLAILRPKG